MKATQNRLHLGLAVTVVLGLGIPALAERETTTPTAWRWNHGASEATLDQVVDEGYRMTDIEIERASPYRFSAVFVRNSGVHQKTWAWKYGYTEDALRAFFTANNLRIIDLEVVATRDGYRLAAVMIRNSGDDAAAWWWYYGKTAQEIEDKVAEHNARIIDLDTYVVDGSRRFSAVMVRNTGDQYRKWWWHTNRTLDQVKDMLSAHHARLVDLERRGSDRYSVVMQELKGEYWWYDIGDGEDALKDFYRQRGARIIDLETYWIGGSKRFAAVLLNNSNDLETRIGKLIRDNTDGVYGFYLKQVGGGVRAGIFETRPFYPASTIKVMEHLYGMWLVDNHLTGIDAPVPRWANHLNDTHGGEPIPPNEPMSDMMRRMMVSSNNQRTNNLQDFYGGANGVLGRAFVNWLCWTAVGMSTDSALNHKLGGGGPDTYDAANSLTLVDVGKLYEGVANGSLLSEPARTDFYDRMLYNRAAPPPAGLPDGRNHSFITGVKKVITEEGTALGLSSTLINWYLADFDMAFKAGSLTVSDGYASNAGWISLPYRKPPESGIASRGFVRSPGPAIGRRDFVYGVFIVQFTANNVSIWSTVNPELLRDEIRKALETFK